MHVCVLVDTQSACIPEYWLPDGLPATGISRDQTPLFKRLAKSSTPLVKFVRMSSPMCNQKGRNGRASSMHIVASTQFCGINTHRCLLSVAGTLQKPVQ